MGMDAGVIAIWSGTLANIPVGWTLCDGNGGTPNLVARFVRGVPAATNPGTTGGLDSHGHATMTSAGAHTHTLASLSHQHTTIAAGTHSHGTGATFKTAAGAVLQMWQSAGSHEHQTSWTSPGHSHSTDSQGGHTHTINTGDGRPPYYEVAYIQASAGAAVATGIIIIWSGLLAAIPAGWSLCDGAGGRPDLRSRFLRGVNTNATNPGTTGGATTHIHTEVAAGTHSHTTTNAAAHYHTFSVSAWTHTHNTAVETSAYFTLRQTDSGGGDHAHANSNTIDTHNHNAFGNDGSHSHTVNAASSLPAYYDVAYIINVSATALPTGGVLIWTGTIANIPATYYQCDGNNSTPNLLSKFLRGSDANINPGGTGGSDTHTHTEIAAGAHSSHTQTSAGNHQHAATDSTGAHTHTTDKPGLGGTGTFESANASDGAHSHTYNNEGAHSNHTVNSQGSHDHQPWSTDDGRPAYYQVAFIWYITSFPTQYSGLRAQIGGAVQELCLVVAADGATGMGGRPQIVKGGTTYAIYLVETADANASAIRIQTTGTKAIRKKT